MKSQLRLLRLGESLESISTENKSLDDVAADLDSMVSVEDVAQDIKEVAERMWEAFLNVLKKLTEWNGDKTRRLERANLLLGNLKDDKVESSPTQEQQHREIERLVHGLSLPTEISDALHTHKEKFPDININKAATLISAHLKYYGHYLFDKEVGTTMEDLDSVVRDYLNGGDLHGFCADVVHALHVVGVKVDGTDLAAVREGVSELHSKVSQYDPKKREFSFDKSVFSVHVEDLKKELQVQKVVFNSWESIFSKFKDDVEYAERNTLQEQLNALSVARRFASTLLDLLDKNVNYIDAMYSYRKSFLK